MAAIDTSIPTTPSGAAATLAAAHSFPHPLKLYGAWFCPFVQRAWMTLVERRIDYQYIDINPYHKAPDFLALNPRGLVPTLVPPPDGPGKPVRKPLFESLIICEYLDEAHRDVDKHGCRLLPACLDSYERARCRLWIDHVNSRIIPAFYKVIQHTAAKPYTMDEAKADLHKHIKTWVAEMEIPEKSGPWFLGGNFSMVDISIAPWAMRLRLIDHFKPGGCGFPVEGKGGKDEKIWQRWRVWLTAILQRQSLLDTSSKDDAYIEVYTRYAEDTTQSLVGQATRKGERLP